MPAGRGVRGSSRQWRAADGSGGLCHGCARGVRYVPAGRCLCRREEAVASSRWERRTIEGCDTAVREEVLRTRRSVSTSCSLRSEASFLVSFMLIRSVTTSTTVPASAAQPAVETVMLLTLSLNRY